jgi:tetratricopeptide (TPR) repeat protein
MSVKPPAAKTGRILHLAGTLVLLLMLAHAAAAGPGLSPQVYHELTRVHDLMDQRQYVLAETRLSELLGQLAAKGYDKAVALQTLAHVQAARDHYAQAAKSLQQSLALGLLPDQVQQQGRYDVAQLYLASGQPGQAVQVLQRWFEHAEQPSADAHFLLGTAYFQLQQYRQAIAALQRAVKAAVSADESWYQTLLAAHYELGDYRGCARVLEKMVRLFPDQEYWQQLAGIYLALNRDERALATLELLYRQGKLDREQDLLQLTQLYLGRGIPYKAARLLETEMQRGRIDTDARNLELLAGAWTEARERTKATDVYQRAMRAGGEAAIGLYLADLYIQDERWKEAAEVLESTLKRDGFSEPGDAWLLLGVARYEEGSPDLARQAFDEAARFEQARSAAQDWLQHLQGQP